MAYLDYTRNNPNTAHQLTLCLTEAECFLILPVIRSSLKAQKKKYEKYYDIHLAGEATERQQTEFFKAEENVKTLQHILELSRDLILKK